MAAIRSRAMTFKADRTGTLGVEATAGQGGPRDLRSADYAIRNSGSDPELVQVGFLEEVVAVGGDEAHAIGLRVLRSELERHLGAAGPEAPDAAPEVGEAGGLVAGDFEHRRRRPCTPARSAGPPGARPATTRRSPASVVYMPSHGRGGATGAAGLQHVVEDRLEQVDRHEHVALQGAGVDLLLHQQRADAERACRRRRSAPRRPTADAPAR